MKQSKGIAIEKDKRQSLIAAATSAIYRQGFNQTTLADVATEANVPLGNVYYYFKTKDALAEALIEYRKGFYAELRKQWEKRNPRDRLLAIVKMTLDNIPDLIKSGCPIGSLCTELRKEGGELGRRASELFSDHLHWLEKTFHDLGRIKTAKSDAIHILTVLEGSTLLSHSFNDEHFIRIEAEKLQKWIKGL